MLKTKFGGNPEVSRKRPSRQDLVNRRRIIDAVAMDQKTFYCVKYYPLFPNPNKTKRFSMSSCNILTHCLCVSIVYFEQINTGCDKIYKRQI